MHQSTTNIRPLKSKQKDIFIIFVTGEDRWSFTYRKPIPPSGSFATSEGRQKRGQMRQESGYSVLRISKKKKEETHSVTAHYTLFLFFFHFLSLSHTLSFSRKRRCGEKRKIGREPGPHPSKSVDQNRAKNGASQCVSGRTTSSLFPSPEKEHFDGNELRRGSSIISSFQKKLVYRMIRTVSSSSFCSSPFLLSLSPSLSSASVRLVKPNHSINNHICSFLILPPPLDFLQYLSVTSERVANRSTQVCMCLRVSGV